MTAETQEAPNASAIPKLFDTLSDEKRLARSEAFLTEAFASMLRSVLASGDATVGIARFAARAHACGLMTSWRDENGYHVAFLRLTASGDTLTEALEAWLLVVGGGNRC